MSIELVIKKHTEEILQLPNVTGMGIGEEDGKEVILVFVKKKVPKNELKPWEIIPAELEGFEIRVKLEIKIGESS